MIDPVVPTIIGTATASLAILLVLLRARFNGRRPGLALAQRWVAAGPVASAGVLATVLAVSLSSFAALMPGEHGAMPNDAARVSSDTDEDPFVQEDLAALRSYAVALDAPAHPTAAAAPEASAAPLPTVDAMIDKLVSRLKERPDDVKGWKMLGWSYLNTGKPEDAARAYETALKLVPGDSESQKGLDAARKGPAADAGRLQPGAGP